MPTDIETTGTTLPVCPHCGYADTAYDELYRDLRVCGKCGVQYTKTEELIHRCRIL